MLYYLCSSFLGMDAHRECQSNRTGYNGRVIWRLDLSAAIQVLAGAIFTMAITAKRLRANFTKAKHSRSTIVSLSAAS